MSRPRSVIARLSIVIPIFNEEGTLPELYQRLRDVVEERCPGLQYEIIFVNDGSTDRSEEILGKFHAENPRVKVLDLSRNFGHQAALTAGLDHATGGVVVCMDGDLQDPPEVISGLLVKWEEGYDVVYAVRRRRKESFIKRALYSLFYRLLGRVSAISIPSDSGDFTLIDRRVVEALNALPERGRFIRGLRAWVGFRQIGVEYERERRFAGSPKYTLRKLISLALDGLLSFSVVPLRAATAMGLLASLGSFMGIGTVLYIRLFTSDAVPGWAATVIPVLFLGGVQLLTIGILGEYLGQVLREVKQRPVYVVRDRLGFEGPPPGSRA